MNAKIISHFSHMIISLMQSFSLSVPLMQLESRVEMWNVSNIVDVNDTQKRHVCAQQTKTSPNFRLKLALKESRSLKCGCSLASQFHLIWIYDDTSLTTTTAQLSLTNLFLFLFALFFPIRVSSLFRITSHGVPSIDVWCGGDISYEFKIRHKVEWKFVVLSR